MTTGAARGKPDSTVRAFIAIEVSESVRDALTELNRRLEASLSGIRWTRPENLHLTLRFLADVSRAQVDRIDTILSSSCEGLGPLALRVEGVGVFPDARRPRILWAGVEAEDDCLVRVQALAEDAARAGGVEPEVRAFHAHITLGRVRRLGSDVPVGSVIEREGDFDGGEFTAKHVSLFESTLTRGGAQYRLIGKYPLE